MEQSGRMNRWITIYIVVTRFVADSSTDIMNTDGCKQGLEVFYADDLDIQAWMREGHQCSAESTVCAFMDTACRTKVAVKQKEDPGGNDYRWMLQCLQTALENRKAVKFYAKSMPSEIFDCETYTKQYVDGHSARIHFHKVTPGRRPQRSIDPDERSKLLSAFVCNSKCSKTSAKAGRVFGVTFGILTTTIAGVAFGIWFYRRWVRIKAAELKKRQKRRRTDDSERSQVISVVDTSEKSQAPSMATAPSGTGILKMGQEPSKPPEPKAAETRTDKLGRQQTDRQMKSIQITKHSTIASQSGFGGTTSNLDSSPRAPSRHSGRSMSPYGQTGDLSGIKKNAKMERKPSSAMEREPVEHKPSPFERKAYSLDRNPIERKAPPIDKNAMDRKPGFDRDRTRDKDRDRRSPPKMERDAQGASKADRYQRENMRNERAHKPLKSDRDEKPAEEKTGREVYERGKDRRAGSPAGSRRRAD